MSEIEIDTFSALHDLIERFEAKTVIYRGIKSVRFPLMPKVGQMVPNGIRSTLKRTLNKYGVDRFSLFPSLDGLAAQIEWLQSNHE